MNVILILTFAGILCYSGIYDGSPEHVWINAETGIPGKDLAWIKSRTKSLSPDSWDMLMKYEALPSNPVVPQKGGGTISSEKSVGTFAYLQGNSRLGLLASMETNVHEIAHSFFSQNVFQYVIENDLELDWENAEGYVYVDPRISFFVEFPRESLFPSSELGPLIPKNIRTFRFDPYITGNTSTQSQGVIGLLDELHAYFLGSRFNFEMLDAYKEAAGSDSGGLFEWVTHVQSSMAAYYEFDFFILEYLLHMKNKNPAAYASLKSYTPFVKAYSTVRSLYSELNDKYFERIRSEMKAVNSSGKAQVRLENGRIWIRNAGSRISNGTLIFSEDRGKLLPVLKSSRFDVVLQDLNLIK
jgi:hypothetical protein